jgi:dolichol-phosphate mannosyltransferase
MGESGAATGRVVIVMPTYNERQNLEGMAGRIRESIPDADLLVVDDNSPDGTGDLADKLAEADPHVHVMHRTEKAGLGRAYVAGFTWALDRGYDLIVEMDADGSHRPEDLPKLLAAVTKADAVIGSRYVPGGTVVNWPKNREILSRGANLYNRLMLGVRIKDATGGFRVYRSETLRKIDLSTIRGADHVRRARARRLEDVQLRHSRVVRPGGAVGHHRPAARPLGRLGPQAALAPARASTPEGERPPGCVRRTLGALALDVIGHVRDRAGLDRAPLPDDLEPLGENGLQVFLGPSLQQHVPVAAGRLGLLRRRRVARASRRHGTADTALPHRR